MAPESLRPRRLTRALVLAALLLIAAAPAHAIRMLNWNVLGFPGTNPSSRYPYYRQILTYIGPDLLVAQEMDSTTAQGSGVKLFLDNVLNANEPGQWAAVQFVNGNDSDCGFFYKPSKIAFIAQDWFYPNPLTNLRLVHEYRFRPVGYTTAASEIRIYAVHLKASTGSANVNARAAEAVGLRDSMNQMPPGTHAFSMGDWNLYTGTEPALLTVTNSMANNVGRLYDPLGLVNVNPWQDNAALAGIDTQSPCKSGTCAPGAATGGLDDRFDLLLPTLNWNDGQGYELIPGSYVSVGNDGLHQNLNLTDPPTIPEGAAFAQALQLASDHLPVRLDIQVPAIAAVAASLDLGTAIGGASADLAISNVAIAPADGLTYALAAPAGFAAPAGTFELAAGGVAHHIVSTTPGGFGPRAGDLALASDDLDHPARTIALTADILDHAHASLDSTVETTSANLDFGTIPAAAFTPATVTVYDFGYTTAQAKLVLSGAAITGGDGHFSITSGDPSATVSSIGQPFEIEFDTTGATPDSQYTATLAVASSDEPLPGATAANTLTMSLSAAVSTGPLAVPAGPGAPSATQLYMPFPNPFAQASRIRFDLQHRAELRLDVIDLSGRRVATLESRAFEPGRYSTAWTGRSDAGTPVPAGVYFIRMTGSSLEPQAVRLAVVR